MLRMNLLSTVFTCALGLVLGVPAAKAHDVGPHKGPLAVWGDEAYHLEIVPDPKTGSVTVYVYGEHEDLDKGKMVAIDATALVLTIKADKPVSIKLDPAPAKGDPTGKASVYTGKHEIFTKSAKISGSISGKAGGKSYSGEFKQK